MSKKINVFLIILYVSIIISGCAQTSENNENNNTDIPADVNDMAFSINGYYVSKEYISQIEKISGKNLDKENFDELIGWAVMNAEAVKLGIEPDSKELEFQMDALQKVLINNKSDGELSETNQWLLQHIETINVSIDEYISYYNKMTYDSLQRKALWEYIEKNTSWDDYGKYRENLLSNADIQIYDSELKAMFD